MSGHRLPTPEEMASFPPPNYIDPETRRPFVLAVEIPLTALVITFVSMRFYSRTVLIRALGADDYFMLAAAVVTAGTSIMTCISTLPVYQTGYHIWDLRPEIAKDPVQTAQMAMATQLLFVCITAFTKVSVLLTYLRIFPSQKNKYFCYAMMVFTTAWAITTFLLFLLQCEQVPVQSYWFMTAYPERKCVSIGPIYYVTGALNVFSDFLIFLWPAKDLAKIQISLKQRIILILMFTIGILVCVAGCFRIWYTWIFINTYDALWHGCTLYVIIAIETSLGIICGCLPACKPLMSKLVPLIFTSTHSSTHRSIKTPKLGGQSFPFQSLGGGIRKEEGFSVEYCDAGSTFEGHVTTTTNVECTRGRDEEDARSASSEEWIMLRDSNKSEAVHTAREGV
ncbi:hypothetical protein EJ04DRAFT_496088 [Polyplosphaeria fusca]|uniref:Rhodopsin domain-containing protein n=1 Tax=Polyplosphaeria fusca TaxID=682080 RepID=A0A9P4QXJ8_9PLEO|nr:hypothetical protein EJ04DRAFT_496088 [Polyplosphaeria fusca]